MKFKEKPEDEKPREKMKKHGASTLSSAELLAILLRTGNKNESVLELSNRIIKEIGSLNKLNEISLNTLIKINGIGYSKASTIIASLELGKRILKKEENILKLNNASKIFNYFKNEFINITQEHFYVLLYNTKLNLIDIKELYIGTTSKIEIEPKEVFKEAIKESATSIIIMHNHPSGDTTPSNSDIKLTKQIIEVGKILGIKVLDHIIISSYSYYSFYENSIKQTHK